MVLTSSNLIGIKVHRILQLFNHIKNNRTHSIIHHIAKKPASKMGLMEVRKFTAFPKAIFINTTEASAQKMARNGIHNKLSLFTFFDVLCFHFNYT